MKRIDTINARPNANGVGKAGFHDNADISGQDATYIDPSWCNCVQEELANAIEGFNTELDPDSKDQLFLILKAFADDINELKQDVKVGDLFLTMQNFDDSSAVALHKGYGTWNRVGDGHALVTQATASNNLAPEFMKTLAATGGSNTQLLTIDHLPPHDHDFVDGWPGSSSTLPENSVRTGNSDGYANDDEIDSLLLRKTRKTGAGESFSVVQNSITIAAWLRVG